MNARIAVLLAQRERLQEKIAWYRAQLPAGEPQPEAGPGQCGTPAVTVAAASPVR